MQVAYATTIKKEKNLVQSNAPLHITKYSKGCRSSKENLNTKTSIQLKIF